MAQQLEGLKLSEDVAEVIIEKGIEYEAYSDDMPDTKKEKLAAAEEIVAFSIDAYVNDKVRSDDEDPAVANAGAQIEEILELAGVEIDDDGEVVFGEPTDDDNGGDDEEPFHPDDYIDGYTELSVVGKVKAVKSLDPDNDEHVAIMEALADWENEQKSPSSRVLNYIDETLGEPEEGEEPADEPEEDNTEPWDGYDKATAADIKKVMTEAQKDEDDPLTQDQVEYVLEYEQGRKAPRKRVIDFCNALLEAFEEDNGGDEPEAEKPKRGRAKTVDKKAAKAEPVAASNGVITLTRDQILAALADGEVEIEIA